MIELETEVVALRAEVTRLATVEAVRMDRLGAGCLIDGDNYRNAAAAVDLLRPIVLEELRRRGVLDRIVAAVERQTELLARRPDIKAVIKEGK